MAAAITLNGDAPAAAPKEIKVGTDIVVAATGFALSHAITFSVLYPSKTTFVVKGTTDGAGALTSTTGGTLPTEHEGLYYITVNDGTSTVTGIIKVWR